MRIFHSGKTADSNDQRYRSSGRFVRILYSLVVLAVVSYAIFFLGRPYLILEGPGIVTAPKTDVAVGFVSDIALAHVEPGDRVYPGALLFTINRADYGETLDSLNIALTDREQDITRVRRELRVAERLVSTLQRRMRELQDVLEKTDARPEIMDLAMRTTLQREYSEASAQLEENLAQLEQLPALLSKLEKNRQELKMRQSEILVRWRNRQIISNQTGIISSDVASEGDTLLTGELMTQILDQRRLYIVWELPDKILRLPRIGERVVIESVGIKIDGRVDRFAAMSNLPMVDGQEHRRLVHVAVDEQSARLLPMLSSVTVRMNYLGGP